METFRCPTCIGVLPDARAKRCPHCGQNIRRRAPKVLGEETRIGANHLPVDRWMLDRLHNDGPRKHALPPVAWHGKFATSPLAEPNFSATAVPTATPLAPPTTVAAPDISPTSAMVNDDDHDLTPPVVGALALDVYTRPISQTDDVDVVDRVDPALEPAPEPVVERAPTPEPPMALAPEPVYTPPPVPTPVPPAPVAQPVTTHEELDPDVRALVDDLYKQAREELSGNDLAFFTPIDEPPAPRVDPIEDAIGSQPIIATPTEAPMFEATPTEAPMFATPTEAPLFEPTPEETPPVVEAPVVEAPGVETPAPAPRPEEPPRSQEVPPTRSGWQPALVNDRHKRRHLSD